MNNSINKILIALVLSMLFFSCGSDDQPNNVAGNNGYITAQVTRNGETFNYNNTSGVTVIKADTGGLTFESVSDDQSQTYQIDIVYSRQPDNVVLSIYTTENNEDLSWVTTLVAYDDNQNTNNNFTITSETDTYIEGAFNFIGGVVGPSDPNDIVTVTNGKFRAKKINY